MQSVKVGFATLASSRAMCSSGLFSPGFTNLSAICRVQCSLYQSRFCQTASKPEETPVIRIPRYMQQKIENVKQTRGKNKIPTVKAGKLLIQSKNPVLNQSAGYILGKFEQPVLSSKGWKHNKSFGDYFTINNIKDVAPFVAESQTEDSTEQTTTTTTEAFSKLRICKELLEVLNSMNITNPTTVQLQTIPKIMSRRNILCAAETGSGKTLSYLLPIIQRLQAEKKSEMDAVEGHRIHAVVIVPSRELAEQVAAVSRALCAPFGFLTKTVGGGRGVGHIKSVFKHSQPDILVATPGALIKALRRRCLDLSELSFFVVDEADTMFDPSFADMLQDILQRTNIARDPKETQGLSRKAQLLVVGATFPGGVGEVLSQVTDLGSMVVIKSKMLHYLMPHVKQTFLKVKGVDKVLELHQALKMLQHEKGGGPAVVFCNKSSTVNWLGYSLDEIGIKHARLQGEMPAVVRTGIFRGFQKGTVDVLVCTDIASRGLDTSQVRLVVNYDFPESHTDYIHRAGRVGRAGGVEDGEVLSFVSYAWDVELVQKIETAARRRTSLPGMESEIQKPQPKVEDAEE
ncbi:probable ATP-dependent RNA helicase DDX28 [Xyrichtys novacula]|uniref:ATP-dependent RNA helicase n=1 Tax=Xyrichtys novacula TaxID=13765 RepID=A0AAV1EJT3_XYRNO|nr:probable ATP-dependent RNA helicase DDX28 [Xyrichtys novacula]